MKEVKLPVSGVLTEKWQQERFLGKLVEIYSDKGQIKKIGKKVIQDAARYAAMDRLGMKVKEPIIKYEVAKGELVPKEVSALLAAMEKNPIAVNPAGEAMWGWGVGWGLFGIWGQIWIDFGDMPIQPQIFERDDILNRILVESAFTEKEIEYLKELGVDIMSL